MIAMLFEHRGPGAMAGRRLPAGAWKPERVEYLRDHPRCEEEGGVGGTCCSSPATVVDHRSQPTAKPYARTTTTSRPAERRGKEGDLALYTRHWGAYTGVN